jgi:FtsP/CotA-like multicopper oxidase with cupredoxin domain
MMTLSRRRLLQLTSASVALGSLGSRRALAVNEPTTLRAFNRTIEVKGKLASVLGLAQADGARGLTGEKGGRFQVKLVNELETETLIHWHGLTPPSEQDGVPGLSQTALPPGESYAYDFLHNRAGTFWMHSHVGLQEQQLLAAPLIVRDPSETQLDEQEVVILLHDFTFRDPQEIFHELRTGMAMSMAGNDGSGQDEQMSGMAMTQTGDEEMAHQGTMDMTESDHSAEPAAGGHGGEIHFNDVDYDAYLANDRTLNDPQVVRVEPGTHVRLRIINAATATNFLLDLGAVEGELFAVDGNPVVPMRGQIFDLAIAQRADIRLALPSGEGAYPILAQREDGVARTGIVLATKKAQVHRLPAHAKHKARPLNLDLERRLTVVSPLVERPSDRTIPLDLTGSHAGYKWGLNEKTFDPNDPLIVVEGERVEVILRNKTAMPHPIHLHGHHFQVVAVDGGRFSGAIRDTVLVPPRRSVTIAFDADNPGHWAFHCHQLYHMAAGMMTSVRYEGYERSDG